MAKKALNQREELFCYYSATAQSPREAAVKAGYSAPLCEGTAARLMRSQAIRERIAQHAEEHQRRGASQLARSGLERLAFGSVADVLRLMLAPEDEHPDPERLDLFNVAEIKCPKGGGFEVKFYDRIKALEKLAAIGENHSAAAGAAEFYQALQQGAAAVFGEPPEDE